MTKYTTLLISMSLFSSHWPHWMMNDSHGESLIKQSSGTINNEHFDIRSVTF